MQVGFLGAHGLVVPLSLACFGFFAGQLLLLEKTGPPLQGSGSFVDKLRVRERTECAVAA